MLSYFEDVYINLHYGPSYLITECCFIFVGLLLLNPLPANRRQWFYKLLEFVLCWLALFVVHSLVFHLDFSQQNQAVSALFLVVYGIFFSRLPAAVCVVRGFVYYSTYLMGLCITEPLGVLVNSLNENFTWAMQVTWIVYVLLVLFILYFLLRFSCESMVLSPHIFPVIVAVGSLLTSVPLMSSDMFDGLSSWFRIMMGFSSWCLNLLIYYLYYSVCLEAENSLVLHSLVQKAELERDAYLITSQTYEKLSLMRHEIKNHDAYLKILLDNQDYEQLAVFIEQNLNKSSQLLSPLRSGNTTIDAVLNQMIGYADTQGVKVQAQIAAVADLPYPGNDLWSLLSNLLSNAIDAARVSGETEPTVRITLRPQQDYLLIRVTNPVDPSIPAERRLSLRSTKSDAANHGYGTKVIALIVDRYKGSVSYSQEDRLFVADIMLLMERENEL